MLYECFMKNKIALSEKTKKSIITALLTYLKDYPDCVEYDDLLSFILDIKSIKKELIEDERNVNYEERVFILIKKRGEISHGMLQNRLRKCSPIELKAIVQKLINERRIGVSEKQHLHNKIVSHYYSVI
jgi:hypothetical protein